MGQATEPELPNLVPDSAGPHLRYRVRHGFSDSLRDENGVIVVHRPVAWRTTTVRIGDRTYLESRTAEKHKRMREVIYRDTATGQPILVVSGSLSKRDLTAEIHDPAEQFVFTYSGKGKNARVSGTTRSGDPVLSLRFLGKSYLGFHDVQVDMIQEAPSAEVLLIAYSVAQHWHRSRYQGGP